ncbi:hypothetical protein ACUXV3_07945 [Roseobacteraceae bacterium NS-SX3]
MAPDGLLSRVAENLPSITFLALIQLEAGLRAAGWAGSAAAALVLSGFTWRGIRFHPVLLGINLYMLAITPLIEGLYRAGFPGAGQFMISHVQTGVLLSVLACGVGLTAFARGGFAGNAEAPASTVRRHSALLLGICAAGVAWSLYFSGSRLLGIALPLMVLFAAQQVLRTRTAPASAA